MQEDTPQKKNAQLTLVLDHQKQIYEESLKRHTRVSLIIIILLSLFIGLEASLIFKFNKQYKEKITQLNIDYTAQKKEIIDTAFYIKDNLIGEYYIDDKKKFEDFMLSGSQMITRTYYSSNIAKKNRMSSKQLKDYLETTYVGANLVGIDPYLLLAIDYVESNFNFRAVSPVGALGICQFMPFTAKLLANARTNYNFLQVDGYDRRLLFDPIYSKKLQIRFVKYLFDEYDGRVEWVLLAYNYGPSKTMARWWKNGKTLFKNLSPDQRKYAEQVLTIYNKVKMGYHASQKGVKHESS